jgi:Asp-tRNA(Asn)/Glu-tRNA(Gln) amidotransferase A subunit family amidase
MSKKWYNYFVSTDPLLDSGAEASPTGQATPAMAGTASAAQTVADIAAMVSPAPVIKGPVDKPTSFETIYQQAEIPPPSHGYTIMKVIEMLQNEHIRNLPAEVKRSSILVALEAAGVRLQEVIEDAVRRDRALDTYERVMQKSVEEMEARKAEENRQIEQELEKMTTEYRARMQANTEELTKRKEEFFGWRLEKQQEEKRIADAVGYFTTENPITTGTAPSAAPAAKKP